MGAKKRRSGGLTNIVKLRRDGELHQKSADSPVYNIDPKDGSLQNEDTVNEVNDLTKVLRFINNRKNGGSFINSIRWQVKQKGLKSLTEKQIQGILNVKENKEKVLVGKKQKQADLENDIDRINSSLNGRRSDKTKVNKKDIR